jgi:hypothetical protein
MYDSLLEQTPKILGQPAYRITDLAFSTPLLCDVLKELFHLQNASEKYRFDLFFTASAFGSCGRLVWCTTCGR